MTNKCWQTRQMAINLRDKLIWGMNSASELAIVYYYIYVGVSGAVASLLRQVTKLGLSLRLENDIAVIGIFMKKERVAIIDAHAVVNHIFGYYRKTYLS